MPFKAFKNSEDATIESIQRGSVSFLNKFTLLQVAFVALAAWVAGNSIALFTGAAFVIGVITFMASKSKQQLLSMNMLAVGLMGQVCLIVAALKGHPYQIDMHMYFFALLGMLAATLSISAILCATVTVAVHHLAIYVLLPLYVFPGESTLIRVVLHAVILLCETGVLLWVIALVTSAFKNATQKKEQAEEALAKAEASDKQRIIAEEQSKKERKELITRVANDFRSSVSKTIADVQKMVSESLAMFAQMAERASKAEAQSQSAASAVQETTQNTSSVAAATEELNSAISEIASQAQRAATNTLEATNDSKASIEVVGRLSNAAEAISEITVVITGIAGQINLLALNATIESARAGEAGKGFAVVAGEVKALASQTESATQQISESIAAMRAVCAEVSDSIQSVGSVVNEINGISTSIAASVEEQSAATKEISGLIQKVSNSAMGINSNVSELSSGVTQTSEDAKGLQKMLTSLQEKAGLLDGESEKFIKLLQDS